MQAELRPYRGEVGPAHALLETCGARLLEQYGLDHWVPAYPARLLERDINDGSVWYLPDDASAGAVAAIVTLSVDPPAYYQGPSWDVREPALYVTRLAVHPRRQASGIGTCVVAAVEREALVRGVDAVRLDACDAQPGLCDWYMRMGFRQCGSYRSPRGGRFVFMEKVLPRARPQADGTER